MCITGNLNISLTSKSSTQQDYTSGKKRTPKFDSEKYVVESVV